MISPIGKIGVRSSGPAGSCVAGLSGGLAGPGRSAMRLTQCVGISDSGSVYLTGSSLTPLLLRWPGRFYGCRVRYDRTASQRRRHRLSPHSFSRERSPMTDRYARRRIGLALCFVAGAAGLASAADAPGPRAARPVLVSRPGDDVESYELAGNARGDVALVWRTFAPRGHYRL